MNQVYFKLVCLYRLQQIPENSFLIDLSQLMLEIKNNAIYIGDININLLEESAISESYNSVLNNNGFISIVNSPTRITHSSKTLIDHIFVRNRYMQQFSSGVFDLGITDHCVLGLKYRYLSNKKL